MIKNPQQLLEFVLALSTFVLVLSVWIGGVVLWSSRRAERTRKVRRRLGLHSGETAQRELHLWHEGREVTTRVPYHRLVGGLHWRIEQMFLHAGWPMTFGQIATMFAGILSATVVFAWYVTANISLAIGVSLAMFVIVRIVILTRITRRESQFEHQLVDALELAARSLRAGHPLLGAFQLLSEEMAPPVRDVFANICQQHGLGAELDVVLREKSSESASSDMKLFATSVAIQMQTGGNLADLMDRLAAVIRDRIRLHRRVRILTAQTQMSKRVLIALPFIMFLLLNVINPKYMRPFYEVTSAKIMLAAAVALLAMGAWVMNRMVRLKY